MDLVIRRGASPEDSPLPLPELAIGNVMRLKRPYPRPGLKGQRSFRWGVIAQHIGHNAWGVPKVSLHLYDGRGRVMMGRNTIPEYVDFVASELILWHVVGAMFYEVVCDGNGFDLYPTCPACRNRNQHPYADSRCGECGGWGHARVMRRLSDV